MRRKSKNGDVTYLSQLIALTVLVVFKKIASRLILLKCNLVHLAFGRVMLDVTREQSEG